MGIINGIALGVCSTMLLCAATSRAADGIERTTVWTRGQGTHQVYRIPAIVMTNSGALLAFCEGRQTSNGADNGEINLLLKRSIDKGKTFGEQSIVWADGKSTCGNPCAVVDRSTGTIWLLMTHNNGADREKDIIAGKTKDRRTVRVTSSNDDGKTWTPPRDISASVMKDDWRWYATGPGIGIQLQRGPHAGRLVIPCDHAKLGGGSNAGNSHLIYSDDHGQTWKLGGEAPTPAFNESQIVELSDSRLMLNMRNYRPTSEKTRGVCISDDGGETFKDLRHDPVLVEPVCQASILSAGKTIYFSNPASDSKRVALTVRRSDDDGATWTASKLICAGPSAYSCLVALPDGSIGVLYERGEKNAYEAIEFARLRM